MAPQSSFQGEEGRHWEMGFGLDILEFMEGLDPTKLLDCLILVEELLDFNAVLDHKWVPLAVTRS